MTPGPLPPPGLRIRPLLWTDFEPLIGIYFAAYDERDRNEPIGIVFFWNRPTAADEVAWFGRLFQRAAAGEVIVAVAELDGRVVGSCTIEPAGPLRASETGHVGVLGILVDRSARGSGVGEALMRSALASARGTFEQVRLAVMADNERAKRLYRRLGFEPCGRFPRGIKRGDRYIDEELMILDLARGPAPAEPANH